MRDFWTVRMFFDCYVLLGENTMENLLDSPKTVSRIVAAPAGDVHASYPDSGIPVFYQQALALHQQGRFCEAEKLYRQILDVEPHDPLSLPDRFSIPTSAAKPDSVASR